MPEFLRPTLLALSLALSFTLCAPATAQTPANSRPAHDAATQTAIASAQGSLDKFLALAAKPPKGSSNFMVKLEVITGDRVRRVWVNAVSTTPEGLKGHAFASIDDPEQELIPNEVLQFKRSDVVDWMYTRNQRQVGGFTICAALAKHPPAARREQMQMYRLDCKN